MISVFGKFTKQNEFWDVATGAPMCGDRILNPISCITSEQLNGDYSIDLQCPTIEEDDSSKFIKPGCVVRTNSGQLFTIHEVNYETVQGMPMIIAKGRHIWYYLNDKIVINCDVDMFNGGYYAIKNIFDHTLWGRDPSGYLTDYDIGYWSDIPNENPDETGKRSTFNGVSVAYALLGSADSIINKWGGELHRDNFTFSINQRREGSRDNAFSIIHGWNCSDIKARISIANLITEISTIDNYGATFGESYMPGEGFPEYAGHQVIGYNKFSYDKQSNIENDTRQMFGERTKADVSFKAKLVNLKDTTAEAGWTELEQVCVGDTGNVYSDVFGINVEQKVISVKRNELTERNEEVELGNFQNSSIHQDKFDKIISGDSAAFRRLDALSAENAQLKERIRRLEEG